jgi:hypothetical protein
VDLDAVGAGAHEGRLGRVPDVLEVDHGPAFGSKALQQPLCRLRRGLRLDQRKSASGEVIALDVDNQQAT